MLRYSYVGREIKSKLGMYSLIKSKGSCSWRTAQGEPVSVPCTFCALHKECRNKTSGDHFQGRLKTFEFEFKHDSFPSYRIWASNKLLNEYLNKLNTWQNLN
jgi:hypothetical protein